MRGRFLLAQAAMFLAAGPAFADDADVIAARDFAGPVMSGECESLAPSRQKPGGGRVHHLSFRVKGQDQDSPDLRRTLVQLACSEDGRNGFSIYVMRNDDQGSWRLLSFAEPMPEYDYADETFSKLKAPPQISGYVAVHKLANSAYSPGARTITSRANWRGNGAWSAGTWRFEDGRFVLGRYEIDPTFEPANAAAEEPGEPRSYVLFDAPPVRAAPAE